MLEFLIEIINSIPTFWIVFFVFALAYIENIFPPAPCDSFIVFSGTFIATGLINPYLLWVSATLGSTLGFVTMYYFGLKFDKRIIESGKIKFISKNAVKKVEKWFLRYGVFLIIANRFIAGTRAAIAFVAGMSKMNLMLTTVLSAISAALWNFILLYLGFKTGENWEMIIKYISLYGKIIAPIVIAIILFIVIRYLLKNKKKSNDESSIS